MNPIAQPIEGSHPPKEDVPATPATSANAGEGKGEPEGGPELSEEEEARAGAIVRAETTSSG
ncbi:hypothetical protein Q4F19_10820 [Sphingomonas sp. BIUV-7]|uniref:Uncharacterized protein n=1 Tax=Sphingomonas natans TaxID=3063330 RepID=A0ABT8Y962_9SPHN|nr:hypothetical protein [Sphingomonas sp. BIUV-7]MDO6414873.1 hypothetical protein [Sphingomonas sp. BIUV-7]